jgi:tetratricopeptide (TPR) repeat protein
VNLLGRAAALLERASPARLEIMIDLSEGQLQQGSFDPALATLAEIEEIAAEIHAERLAVRTVLMQARVEQFKGGGEGSATRAVAAADRAIRTLEPLGDDVGLAHAWRLLMITEVLQGHLEEAAAAAQNVVRHARAAGDTRLAARSAVTIAYVLLHGPTPVPEACARCEELLANVEGDRAVESVLDGTLAVLRAMEGSFDVARDLYRRGQAIAAELGGGLVSHSSSIDSSRVELLAGDLAAAEIELRRDYEALDAIDETYFRSTISAYLAHVLWLAGDPDGALAYSEIAERIGDAEDVLTQVPWRSTRALVLASRGDVEGARLLATQAVDIARSTPQRLLQAEALVGLADVLEATGDHESSGPPLREALTLFEQKGDVVSAGRLRDRIGAAISIA